jgi:hypothetical protein
MKDGNPGGYEVFFKRVLVAKHKVGSSTLLTRSIIKPLILQGLFISLLAS